MNDIWSNNIILFSRQEGDDHDSIVRDHLQYLAYELTDCTFTDNSDTQYGTRETTMSYAICRTPNPSTAKEHEMDVRLIKSGDLFCRVGTFPPTASVVWTGTSSFVYIQTLLGQLEEHGLIYTVTNVIISRMKSKPHIRFEGITNV
jgi:hypothetical protein